MRRLSSATRNCEVDEAMMTNGHEGRVGAGRVLAGRADALYSRTFVNTLLIMIVWYYNNYLYITSLL